MLTYGTQFIDLRTNNKVSLKAETQKNPFQVPTPSNQITIKEPT
jgi:hypothetical protein